MGKETITQLQDIITQLRSAVVILRSVYGEDVDHVRNPQADLSGAMVMIADYVDLQADKLDIAINRRLE